jgi:hypothetical protein
LLKETKQEPIKQKILEPFRKKSSLALINDQISLLLKEEGVFADGKTSVDCWNNPRIKQWLKRNILSLT